jgi:proline dehydrogenase
MLRRALLSVSHNTKIKSLALRVPITRDVVSRYVAGETADDAVGATRRLTAAGLFVSLDHLGEDTTELGQADAVTDAYIDLLGKLSDAGLTKQAEVSVKLSAVGQSLGADGERVALDNTRMICTAAKTAGTTVTLDMEDHTTTDSTLGILAELRSDFPSTGAVIQAYLHRSEADCRDLAVAGSRVRLCKGAYDEPASVAFTDDGDVDKAYVRCLKILMAGPGYPMIATHDPRLVPIAQDLAKQADRSPDSYEFQMLFGIRPTEQQRLANAGHRMRIYLPYGQDWYGYLVRRMAERPANLALFVRSLVGRT